MDEILGTRKSSNIFGNAGTLHFSTLIFSSNFLWNKRYPLYFSPLWLHSWNTFAGVSHSHQTMAMHHAWLVSGDTYIYHWKSKESVPQGSMRMWIPCIPASLRYHSPLGRVSWMSNSLQTQHFCLVQQTKTSFWFSQWESSISTAKEFPISREISKQHHQSALGKLKQG